MAKKILFAIVLFALVLAGAGALLVYKQIHKQRLARVNAKAQDLKFTIIEGWGVADVAKNLSSQNLNPSISAASFLATEKTFDTSSYPLLASKPAAADLEGFLFPDTYFIPAVSQNGASAIVIKKALDNFSLKFNQQMQAQARADNLSVFQIVALASIIEKETGRNVQSPEQKQSLELERKIIAGIFYNRLKLSMPLESDATVNYVTGKNTPQASGPDTQIDSPYNTYKYKGLPPGPICNPSLSSLMAALYPNQNNYLYFLHDQKTGQAIYSKTYEEHLKNKAKYLQ